MANPRQNNTLLYLIMTLGLVVGFLYSSGSDPSTTVPPLDLNLQLASLRTLQGARIDTTIITSTQFSSLRVFGSLPVRPVPGGKSDPFQ